MAGETMNTCVYTHNISDADKRENKAKQGDKNDWGTMTEEILDTLAREKPRRCHLSRQWMIKKPSYLSKIAYAIQQI